MTYEEIQKLQQNDAILLVDIRENDEVQSQPGFAEAIHVPVRQVVSEIEAGYIPTDKKIVTICAAGGRCQVLTEALHAQGIDADYLEGGLSGIK